MAKHPSHASFRQAGQNSLNDRLKAGDLHLAGLLHLRCAANLMLESTPLKSPPRPARAYDLENGAGETVIFKSLSTLTFTSFLLGFVALMSTS